jgi:hypothetical protein
VTPEGARDIYVEVYGNVDGFETPMAFHLKYKLRKMHMIKYNQGTSNQQNV